MWTPDKKRRSALVDLHSEMPSQASHLSLPAGISSHWEGRFVQDSKAPGIRASEIQNTKRHREYPGFASWMKAMGLESRMNCVTTFEEVCRLTPYCFVRQCVVACALQCSLHSQSLGDSDTSSPAPWQNTGPSDWTCLPARKITNGICFWIGIFSIPHMRYQALCLRTKRWYGLLEHPPNDSPFIIMICDIHLLKFYYFCNLIQFVPPYCCSGQCFLTCPSSSLG